MASSGSFTDFNRLLDKATNPMQLEADNESVKKICYAVDKGVVEASYAVQALYGKMTDENPHTVLFALRVLEKIFYDCGSLAHKVICTENFMCLLKDIVQTTEHKLIRNKILELVQTWADTFRYLPKYSAPEKLLTNLQSEGYVFPSFQSDLTSESKKQLCIGSGSCGVKQSECIKIDPRIDIDMKNREDCFKQILRAIQEKKKADFKKHQKSLGLPTSSDEEENFDKKQESQLPYEGNYSKTHVLHPDLRKIKVSRQAVDKELESYRLSKKEEYKQMQSNGNGDSNGILKLRKLEDKCSTCEMYKKKCNHDVVFERSTHKLHPDLRKVKESKEIIKNGIEEVNMQKTRDFYSTKSNHRTDDNTFKKYRNKSSFDTDNEELQKALELSKTDTMKNIRKPSTRLGEMEEQKAFDEAIRLSLLQTDSNISMEDEELQRAIDMSVNEAEDKNFSPFPKLSENDEDNATLSYIAELSLNDSYQEELKLAEYYAGCDAIELCVICRDKKPRLKSFMPCNHRCICGDCSQEYIAQICPICRAFYTSITF